MRMNTRSFLVELLLIMCFVSAGMMASVASAQDSDDSQSKPMKVVLKDGRVLVGNVSEANGKVDVETKMGIITLKKMDIDSMTPAAAPTVEYSQKRQKIEDRDSKGLYSLARWAWKSHRNDNAVLELAKKDLETAIKIKPDYTLAKLLLNQINAKLKGAKPVRKPRRTTGTQINPVRSGSASNRDLVDKRDVYWIRLMEFRSNDKVSVTFTNNVLNRYIDAMKGSYEGGWDKINKERQFRSMPNYRKVAEMVRFKEDDTSIMKDIEINRDPKFMVEFRSKIWPTIRQYCGNAACHGGPKPKGGLKLFVLKGNDKALYTNFIILSGTSFGGKQMIDRGDPERSLLVQYLLNPNVARDLHPLVRGTSINHAFPNIKSGTYRRMIKWIRSLKSPAPNYHLKWTPPKGMNVNSSGKSPLPKAALNQDEANKLEEENKK